MMKNICQNVPIQPMLPGQQTPISQNYLKKKCSSLDRMHHWLFMGDHLSSAPKTRDAFLSTHCRQLTSKAVS